jgi:RNA polymerase sigma-70 factor (ECF subfamily)
MISTSPQTIQDRPAIDDEALVSRAIQNPAAFAGLYQRHFQRVYRYHIARTGDTADAQDLTAQTFMAALEGLTTYKGTGSFAAWLMGIARHKLAMSYRSRMVEEPLQAAEDLPDQAPLPEAAVTRRLQLSQVSRLLLDLTPERAEALALCVFADLTATEAAQAMGKTPSAVKMLVYRGLRDLRGALTISPQEEK